MTLLCSFQDFGLFKLENSHRMNFKEEGGEGEGQIRLLKNALTYTRMTP